MKRAAIVPALALLLMAAGDPPTSAGNVSAAAAERETEHVVRPGETLMGIAIRAKVPRVLIAEANGLRAPYALRAGQKLKIPRTRRHTVAAGDTGFSIAYELGVPWRDIAVANSLDPDKPLRPGQVLLVPTVIAPPAATTTTAGAKAEPSPAPTPSAASRFAWPLAGPVRRGFTARTADDENYHDGIDITAAGGTAARAAAAGKVLFAGNEPKQYGNLVVLDHGNGWVSAYAFLSRVTVVKDADVRAGERVGLVGNTGLARGFELHFELRRNNLPIDPITQLPPRGTPRPAARPAATSATPARRVSQPAANPAPRTRSPSSDKPSASSRSQPAAAARTTRSTTAKAKSRD